jgi:hypothetical protein
VLVHGHSRARYLFVEYPELLFPVPPKVIEQIYVIAAGSGDL